MRRRAPGAAPGAARAAAAAALAALLLVALPAAGAAQPAAPPSVPALIPPPPAAPPDPAAAALEPLRRQARDSVADLQVAVSAVLPVWREAALALIDTFFLIPDVPLDEAADQLMVWLLLPDDRRDPRYALLGQVVQTWPALAGRAAAAGTPLPYWAARGFDRTRLVRAACIMWGRGPQAYRAAAERAGVPAEAADRCQAFYRDVTRRWDRLLSHAFAADAALGPGRGVMAVEWAADLPDAPGVRAMRQSATLEAIAEQITRDFVLPEDLVIAVSPCAEPDVVWERSTRTVRVCSGLLAAFDALIRPAYAGDPR